MVAPDGLRSRRREPARRLQGRHGSVTTPCHGSGGRSAHNRAMVREATEIGRSGSSRVRPRRARPAAVLAVGAAASHHRLRRRAGGRARGDRPGNPGSPVPPRRRDVRGRARDRQDPEQTIAAAVAIQRRLAKHRQKAGFAPPVRIGLHAADANQVGDNFRGRGVHEAARIAGLAKGGRFWPASPPRAMRTRPRRRAASCSRGSRSPSRSSRSSGSSAVRGSRYGPRTLCLGAGADLTVAMTSRSFAVASPITVSAPP